MAVLFDDASSESLSLAAAVISAYPCTFAGWFYHDAAQAGVILTCENSAASDTFSLEVTATHQASLAVSDGVTSEQTSTVATGALNAWHHACGVFTNATSRTIYLDGANAVTGTNNITPSPIDRTRIGNRDNAGSPIRFFSGRLAEVAIWTVALDAAEVAALGKGFSPLLIRPTSLAAYWPLDRNSFNKGAGTTTLDRWKNGHNLTENNTPQLNTDGPRIYYPTGPR